MRVNTATGSQLTSTFIFDQYSSGTYTSNQDLVVFTKLFAILNFCVSFAVEYTYYWAKVYVC